MAKRSKAKLDFESSRTRLVQADMIAQNSGDHTVLHQQDHPIASAPIIEYKRSLAGAVTSWALSLKGMSIHNFSGSDNCGVQKTQYSTEARQKTQNSTEAPQKTQYSTEARQDSRACCRHEVPLTEDTLKIIAHAIDTHFFGDTFHRSVSSAWAGSEASTLWHMNDAPPWERLEVDCLQTPPLRLEHLVIASQKKIIYKNSSTKMLDALPANF
ncbi:hypothetical protein CEUSTIGMA_g13464.t1 [Chlamydomonas eustigma]|uniref:Uncharacterized protein n=1 Tax=Chlamydomonas eustigma TaxID=1157962 RepID=A0A250XSW5_9CHLO|nr:hypothetical protein CEUSTIGMA_g13464.t1 [Chlamydomonas eustigma]|eukprot:GAX86049.1 hypothetical protein CEUSTIGMA_g13464.t1 [Chlamydomonas eustigma]